jgi:hypothetical protein
MTDEKDNITTPQSGASGKEGSKEEVALELMRFIASTTGYAKSSAGAGFGGKAPKTPEDGVEALLSLYERCRSVVEKKN